MKRSSPHKPKAVDCRELISKSYLLVSKLRIPIAMSDHTRSSSDTHLMGECDRSAGGHSTAVPVQKVGLNEQLQMILKLV